MRVEKIEITSYDVIRGKSPILASDNFALVAIKAKYIKEILAGSRQIELRKSKPSNLGTGDAILLYESGKNNKLYGIAYIHKITKEPVDKVWRNYNLMLGMTKVEYYNYYNGYTEAICIGLKRVLLLPAPISLKELRVAIKKPNFKPQLGYVYLTYSQVDKIIQYSAHKKENNKKNNEKG